MILVDASSIYEAWEFVNKVVSTQNLLYIYAKSKNPREVLDAYNSFLDTLLPIVKNLPIIP